MTAARFFCPTVVAVSGPDCHQTVGASYGVARARSSVGQLYDVSDDGRPLRYQSLFSPAQSGVWFLHQRIIDDSKLVDGNSKHYATHTLGW